MDLRGLAEPGCCNHLRHFESTPSLNAFQSAPEFFDIVEENSELFPVSLDQADRHEIFPASRKPDSYSTVNHFEGAHAR